MEKIKGKIKGKKRREKALETGKYPTGIFYKIEGEPTFSDLCAAYKTDKSPLYSRELNMDKLKNLIISKRTR
ncbi:MAG: hypothetical protein ACTSXK_04770 [Promethearchaeota archaeon]